MSPYLLGGWSQSLSAQPPKSFDTAIYGMVTNLSGLTTGTQSSPGWSPAKARAPETTAHTMWTYGGGLCSPENMPSSQPDIQKVVDATRETAWAGVDVDDECNMNIDGIISIFKGLEGLQKSYTFLAGWDYTNPDVSELGKTTNEKVAKLAETGLPDRFILMCYGSKMWSKQDIETIVPKAVARTVTHTNDPKKVILALTPAGLTDENLAFFLETVTTSGIGGLFIWNYPTLSETHLETIEQTLKQGGRTLGS